MKAFISPHWFKFTIPKELTEAELETVCEDLFCYKFSQFDKLYKCRDKYRDCYTLSELVSIYCHGWANNKGTTCFDISGTGLDSLGLDVAKLGKYALDNGGNICRIDLATLDTGKYIPYDKLLECCSVDNFKRRVRTRFNRGSENVPKIELQPVRRILFGSEQSDNYIVIYDRQQTQKLDYSCICIEQRITNREDCAEIVRQLIAGEDAGSYFAGLLRGKIEFLENSKRLKRLRQPESWWLSFLGDCERRKIKRASRKGDPSRPITRTLIRKIDTLRRRRDQAGLETTLQHAKAALEEVKMAA